MFPRRKCLYFYFSPMKKIILGVVCALALPLLSVSADTSSSTTAGTGTTTQTGVVRPPMGSGAMIERELKSLHMAMAQLSPADREALVKMIKDYLVSKGIDPVKYAEKRDEIKELRKDTREDVKEMRKKTREATKAKREEMREKIKEIRGNGKATFKEFTVTK